MGDVPLIPYIAVIVEGDAFALLDCTGSGGFPIFLGCSDFTTAIGENLIVFFLKAAKIRLSQRNRVQIKAHKN